MGTGNLVRNLIWERTGIKPDDLKCPREKSDMTPCVARDGDSAMTDDSHCIGCGVSVVELLKNEKAKITTKST